MSITVKGRNTDVHMHSRTAIPASRPIIVLSSDTRGGAHLGRAVPHALVPIRAHGGHGHSRGGKSTKDRVAEGEENHNQVLPGLDMKDENATGANSRCTHI